MLQPILNPYYIMNKKIFIFTLLFVTFYGFSQDTIKGVKPHTFKVERSYMDIKSFRKVQKRAFTKSDTLNFMYKDNDTLVLLTQKDENKFVSVPFEYKDENFLKIYKSVTFRKNNDGKKSYQRYWKEPLRIFVSESISKKRKSNFINFTDEITKGIDSLNVQFVKNLNDANFVIYQKGDFEYENNLKKLNNDYYIWWNNNMINRGFIKIDPEINFNDNLFSEALNKLFIKTLGHFEFTNLIDCSNYFSNCDTPVKKFSKLDYEILKYHYSYGICKGLDEESFDDFHTRAKEHKKNFPNIPYKIKHTN